MRTFPSHIAAAVAMLACLPGCSLWQAGRPPREPAGVAAEFASAPTRAQQTAATPDAVLSRLKAGNERFVSGSPAERNAYRDMQTAAQAQSPYAAVVSCTESRFTPELAFDQGIGDLFSARVPGRRITREVLGSLEFAAQAGGVKAIVVLAEAACDQSVVAQSGAGAGTVAPVRDILSASPLLRAMVRDRRIVVVSASLDADTGKVRFDP
jgi:hypothetical protein